MKLEDQVVSLELAKRLKELGVKQESYFDWFSVKGDRDKDCYVSSDDAGYGYKLCSAFTVAELGEMLPSYAGFQDQFPWKDASGDWWVTMENPDQYSTKTEADARANMLIYLIEQRLINP